MPAAFYRGYNSPQINSQAQSNTTSGNPGLVYNTPQRQTGDSRNWMSMLPQSTQDQMNQRYNQQQQQQNAAQYQGSAAQQQAQIQAQPPQMQQSVPGQQQQYTAPQIGWGTQAMQQSNPGQQQTMQAPGAPQVSTPMQFSLGNMASNYVAPNIDGQAQTIQQSNPGTAQTMATTQQTPWQQRQAVSGNGGGYAQPIIRGQLTTARGF